NISQTHIEEQLQFSFYAGDVGKEFQSFLHRHIQYFGNVLSLESDFQGLPIIPFPLTDLTGDINIGKKVHLDLDGTLASTGLTPSSFDIKTEATRPVASHSGFGRLGEDLPDISEGASVGSRIGTGRPANGRLIYFYDLIYALNALYLLMLPWPGLAAIDFGGEGPEKDLI
ncbi:hypothetical protein HKBW3S47_02557, partial [Candidatus Hakubella thermalkaliphila]